MSDSQSKVKYAVEGVPSKIAPVVGEITGLPLPPTVQWLDDLAKIETKCRNDFSSDGRFGCLALSLERAKLHSNQKSDHFVRGGFCDKLFGKKFSLSKDWLQVGEYSVAIGLDMLAWANVPSFEQFYCMYLIPYSYILLEFSVEDNDVKKCRDALKDVNTIVFKDSSLDEAKKSLIVSGIRKLIPQVTYRDGELFI